jgi:hypothetical protein
MKNEEAKKIIHLLCQKWKIGGQEFLFEIVDFLDKKVNKKISFSNEFEFSLIEGEPKIRLLHLNFWQPDLSIPTIKKILKKKEAIITFIFQKISQKFKSSYNFFILKSLFQFNQKNGLWPIQFGLECQKNFQPKLKIYLSLIERKKERFSLKKFCEHFQLKYQILRKKIKGRKFDTTAIDFLPQNRVFLKIYPFREKNKGVKGVLWRVSSSSQIGSKKVWQRFPEGVNIEKFSDKIKIDSFIKKFIKENNFKVHYFCLEKNKPSIYFR